MSNRASPTARPKARAPWRSGCRSRPRTLPSCVQRPATWPPARWTGAEPAFLDQSHLGLLASTDYFVCERGWGKRVLLLLCVTPQGPAAFLLDKTGTLHYNQMTFPQTVNSPNNHNGTLIDGEIVLYPASADKPAQRVFVAFDLLAVNGVSVTQRSLNTRLGIVQQDIILPHKSHLQKHPELLPNLPFKIDLREQQKSYGLGLVLSQMSARKSPSIGLIFTPVRAPYTPGKNPKPIKLLKWIFPECRFACFKIKTIWDKEHKPHYQLFLADRSQYKYHDDLSPEPELAQMQVDAGWWRQSGPDGKIADFRYDPHWQTLIWEHGYAGNYREGGWRFVKFRKVADDERMFKEYWPSIRAQ
ncbi:mRNA capping enzyme, catalytic domain-containing protein [Entophlyctis helioformis]|nr:mRNA capping enzyme, catalytic domain-containing protein [Entophlyctis helioformis]